MRKKVRLSELQRKMVGFKCKSCGCTQLFVVYTRVLKSGGKRRIRECRECGARIITVERES